MKIHENPSKNPLKAWMSIPFLTKRPVRFVAESLHPEAGSRGAALLHHIARGVDRWEAQLLGDHVVSLPRHRLHYAVALPDELRAQNLLPKIG